MNCPRCGERVRVPKFDGRCRACGNSYLQPFAIRCLKRWSWTSWPDSAGRVPRNGPTEGFYCHDVADPDRGPYLFACKRGLHEGVYASFSKTLLGAALQGDPHRTLVLFVGPGPYGIEDALVFDPRRVINQADERERNHVDSKRERNVPIFDASATAHGIGLGDYLAGRQTLPGPVGDGLTPTSLREFGIEAEVEV